MSRGRTFLRGLSICVTVLLMGSGIVMIGVGFSNVDRNIPLLEALERLPRSDGVLVLQVFGVLTLVLSALGICSTSVDLKPLLMVFSVLLLVEFVALLIAASPLIGVESQMSHEMNELFVNVTPLHRANGAVQRELNTLQASASCCGLRSSDDWEDRQPTSCLCSTTTHSCVEVEGGSVGGGQLQVHSQACGDIVTASLHFPVKLRIAVVSAAATIMMVCIPLCVSLALESRWRTSAVETSVDDFNRVKYKPKPSLT